MSDFLIKLRILRTFLVSAFVEWRNEVWRHDLDTHYCCPGTARDECGCMGATRRDIYGGSP